MHYAGKALDAQQVAPRTAVDPREVITIIIDAAGVTRLALRNPAPCAGCGADHYFYLVRQGHALCVVCDGGAA